MKIKDTAYKDFLSGWEMLKKTLSKQDIALISCKDGFKHAIKGFMTSSYYKRGKLIDEGQLVLGYIFKTWSSSDTNYSPYWVLFSPIQKINDNPQLLKEAAQKLSLGSETLTKKLAKLLREPLSEAEYFELPESITNGNLVYLSIVYLRPEWRENIRLGVNPFLASQGISKEILFLPDKFWSEDFKEAYYKNELI